MGYVDFYTFLMPLYALSLGFDAAEVGILVGARSIVWMARISVIFMAGPLAAGPDGRPRAYRHLTPRTGRGQAGRTWRVAAVNA
jgi:hypothetical protein